VRIGEPLNRWAGSGSDEIDDGLIGKPFRLALDVRREERRAVIDLGVRVASA
jgi:hypothetical protein